MVTVATDRRARIAWHGNQHRLRTHTGHA
jgi:hypothetical protein